MGLVGDPARLRPERKSATARGVVEQFSTNVVRAGAFQAFRCAAWA